MGAYPFPISIKCSGERGMLVLTTKISFNARVIAHERVFVVVLYGC